MKSRVRSVELVLLYHLENTSKGEKIQETLRTLGIRCKYISSKMLCQTVGVCAELPQYELKPSQKTDEFKEEVIVFCGFSRWRMEEILEKLRERHVPSVALKAMVTRHNRDWTLQHLFLEIQKEHMMMSGYTRIQFELAQAEKMPNKTEQFKKLIEVTRQAIKDPRRLTLNQIYVVGRTLEEAMKRHEESLKSSSEPEPQSV